MNVSDYEIQLEIEKHKQETGGELGYLQARRVITDRRLMAMNRRKR